MKEVQTAHPTVTEEVVTKFMEGMVRRMNPKRR